MWQNRIFLAAGCLAAILLAYTAVSSAVGLSTSEKPTPPGHFDIPTFAALVECDAHFSNEILRLKNNLPAHSSTEELPLLHKNYRRLHRLLRQVGRRDGIAPAEQTAQLRNRVRQLNQERDTNIGAARNTTCRAMAQMPIARERYSQQIVGR